MDNLNILEKQLKPILDEYFRSDKIQSRLSGREVGHSLADEVKTKVLDSIESLGHPLVPNLPIQGRSKYGDFNLYDHPVRIKFGISGKGAPNLLSLPKLIKGIDEKIISSLYIIKIHFSTTSNSTKVYAFDLFDYLHFVNFNGGTGQTMLRESEFFLGYGDPEVIPTIDGKLNKLIDIYVSNMNNHIELKQRQLTSHEKLRR